MKIVSRVVCCCPTAASSKPGKIGVLRGGQVAEVSACCPTESEQIPQIHFAPQRRPQEREESGKGVIPAAHHTQETHQDVEQQGRPDLPAHRVSAVTQEIAQLQALLDLFKEHLDLPTAAIQIGHTGSAPSEVVGQKLHLALLAI